MTSPNVPVSKRLSANDDSFSEWAMVHKRQVGWSLAALAVILGGIWFYQRSQTLKAQRAEGAYFQARRSAASGNIPLAISDLQKVTTRYEGTRAGTQAALSLAQAMYDQKKFKEGVDVLKRAEAKAPDEFRSSLHVLQADGYEELKDFGAAAQQYKLASEATRFPVEKANYQAAAAREFMAAGKKAEARAIWSELAKDETSPLAAEAKVRLGEVVAQPMKI